MALTQGITSRSFGGNVHDAGDAYTLPADIDHVEQGHEVVTQQPDPGKQSSLAKPTAGKRHGN